MPRDVEALFAEIVERHITGGTLPSLDEIAGGRPDLLPELRQLVDRYLALTAQLEIAPAAAPATPPSIPGFRVIEPIGAGGIGDVYKLEDLTLHRLVAAKVIRGDARIATGLADFLKEARTLALFTDRRIVQIHEFRADATPPVLLMEFVDGFELGRIGPSLDLTQRVRIMREVCEAVAHAHALGLQHRDLKPSNIMLDASLQPKILDFGLSARDPTRGHLRGTPRYLAPEQLDPAQPITARADIYALGAILYELLSGAAPFAEIDEAAVVQAVRHDLPRLPADIAPSVPEPLQAIALTAMERRPEDRYASAQDMALDLARFLDGLPVLARPSQYQAVLTARVRPHLDHIDEWQRLRLVYPHEAERLRAGYRQLDAREDDWIVSGRVLSWSQIALYFGAFLLLCGGVFYFSAHRFHGAVVGVVRPLLVLGVPCAGLTLAGRRLYDTGRRAVAVAFFLAGAGLLPLLLVIVFHEAGWWSALSDAGQLFPGAVSNRQLQITVGVTLIWAGVLAWRTRTVALSSAAVALGVVFVLTLMTDVGLRQWIDANQYDHLALRLMPLVVVYAIGARRGERTAQAWLARPLYTGAAVLLVATFDLLALNGRLFHTLGVSMQPFQPAKVDDPVLIDTLAGLTLNGLLFYTVATLISRRSTMAASAAGLLFVISPFSTLEPLAYLVETQQYSVRFDWIYLALAVGTVAASHYRQRKSFYYAGLLNTGVALYFIAARREWFNRPAWAMALVAAGMLVLLTGYWLDKRSER